MNGKTKKLLVASFIALDHLILGNIVGIYSDSMILGIAFLPYSFIAGQSSFHGWDGLSLLLEIVSFVFFFGVAYKLITFFSKK